MTNIWILRESRRLEARVGEFVHESFQRHAVLKTTRDRKREAIHETRKRGTFLRHFNEDLARCSLLEHPDNDVALVTPNRKLVRDRLPFVRQRTPLGTDEQVPLFRCLGASRFFLFVFTLHRRCTKWRR